MPRRDATTEVKDALEYAAAELLDLVNSGWSFGSQERALTAARYVRKVADSLGDLQPPSRSTGRRDGIDYDSQDQ